MFKPIKEKMKKLFSIQGWLVMAVALTMGFASCSNDSDDKIFDNSTSEQSNSKQIDSSTIFVSIGVGIDNNSTRSVVDNTTDPSKYTLKFTKGDKLWVRAAIGSTGKIVAGELSTKEGDFDNTTGGHPVATFKGYLTIYDGNRSYAKSEYKEFTTDNPFNECTSHTAWLIPEDGDYNFNVQTDKTLARLVDGTVFAENVAGLMEQSLKVTSSAYSAGVFTLTDDASQPIINCKITGLHPSDFYKIEYLTGAVDDNYTYMSRKGYFVSDESGVLSFAFYGQSGETLYHAIRLTNPDTGESNASDTEIIKLKQDKLDNKVYYVERVSERSSEANAHTRPTVDPTVSYTNNIATEDGAAFSISGTSVESYFSLKNTTETNKGTVTLTLGSGEGSPLAVCVSKTTPFINVTDANNLVVNLSGNYVVIGNHGSVINAAGNLKLTTASGTHTLTIVVPKAATEKGLYGSNYNSSADVSALSDVTCNVALEQVTVDGEFYTYIYTVTKN